MTLGGILEWVLGNTFPAVVFCVFGTFWLAYAGTLNPSFAAFASYAPPDAKTPAEGLATPGFNASLGERRPAAVARTELRQSPLGGWVQG